MRDKRALAGERARIAVRFTSLKYIQILPNLY
jgi:hypothetical protein